MMPQTQRVASELEGEMANPVDNRIDALIQAVDLEKNRVANGLADKNAAEVVSDAKVFEEYLNG